MLSLGVAHPAATVRVPRDEATVMLAIDVSLSMEATDVLPSRIAAAKTAGKTFVGLLPPRINLGLVSFGGSANLLVPPTLDRAGGEARHRQLQLQKSTAIGEAIFTSLQAIQMFAKSTTAQGRQAAAGAHRAAQRRHEHGRPIAVRRPSPRRKKAHVQVSTIAFGTPTGTVTIDGRVQPVPADNAALHDIANETGGSFHTARVRAGAASRSTRTSARRSATRPTHRDISWRFLLAGLLVLFAAGGRVAALVRPARLTAPAGSGLRVEDELADRAAVEQRAVRVGGALERVGLADDRPQVAAGDQRPSGR